ncbi:hypothetical protein BRE01_17940 [Brevibacillus reuszeri]|uniref:Beta-xylosidase C-terminal Concanavalin A-like domain-containing protein n=1 Tax=Brevibacillus reuszeri TaxID=54915 RepID=A0A0K9Z070_9BACL|nr:hypothetical protein [Brevibacillus reuszeri]KNB74321.1 hypothetical protein ADS79_01035 [Brevibacillus reuszeri]MED1856219.1 hypothetical protein [Brevibacillus reuszeri]GED68092.1 hypothetical protein BRE01_17940 [Brevibacillus reuszeri]
MSVVSLRRSGFIYEDHFDSPSLDSQWNMTPNDSTRWSLSESSGSLRLKSGAQPLYLFLDVLSSIKQFVFDVKNSYNPTEPGNTGGIAVFADSKDFFHIEEYYDSSLGTAKSYPWLRLVRSLNTYSAYWSDDGVIWNIIGSEEFNRLAPKIGIYLASSSNDYLDAQQVRVFSLPEITVSNLSPNTFVELLDSQGNVVDAKTCRTGNTSIRFDMTKHPIPFTGSLRFIEADGKTAISSSETFEMWGGDEYSFSPSLTLFFIDVENNEVQLQDNTEEFLGHMLQGQYREIKMLARNTMKSGTFTNIKAVLTAYAGTDQYKRLVEVAPDNQGTPGKWSDTFTLPDTVPGQEHVFWARISRETDPLLIEKTTHVHFGLNLSSFYSI